MLDLDSLGFFGIGFLELLIVAAMVGIPAVIAVVVIIYTAGKKNRMQGAGNLAPCPDCQSAVSVRAQTCPRCGAPLKPLG